MDRIEIKPYDYGRQTERRRQARRRARRRAFFLAAAELAAGVCMTMAVMAMVIPEKRELGMAGTEQGRIKQEITERERIERQFTGRGGTEILSRILEDTHVLQSSIKGQGESLLSFGNQNSLYTGPPVIAVDAGHGGARDPGAVYEGRQEKDDNLKLVLAIGEILSDRGIDVEYTRTTDVYETPYEKAMKANNAGVDLFISIHRNSFPADNEVEGVESLIYDLSGLKYKMAEDINEQLEGVGFVNLGVKARPDLVVLKRTKMPAILVEAGFLNSDTDNRLFDDNFEDIAQAIADGILDTLESNGLIKEEKVPVYRVQVGLFRNQRYANRLQNELLEQEYPVYIDRSGPYYRVYVGEFDNLNDAVQMERRLKRAGYQTLIVQEKI